MKKVISILILVCAIFMCSCSKQMPVETIDIPSDAITIDIIDGGSISNKVPTYYNPSPIFFEAEQEEEANKAYPEGKELTQEQEDACKEIFENVKSFYGIEKEIPRLRSLSAKEMAAMTGTQGTSIEVTGSYRNNTIYIISDFSKKRDAGTIAHEFLHYLSDNANGEGLSYVSQGQTMGNTFNEGVTNYLSTKVYPFEEEKCVYEYETHVAEMLAIAIGEENLAKAYFSSDIESLKEDFNDSLKDIYSNEIVENVELTPFDNFVGCLWGYSFLLSIIEEDPEEILPCIFSEADTVEEMLLFYGETKGVRPNMENKVKEFVSNEYLITWSVYSNFLKML